MELLVELYDRNNNLGNLLAARAFGPARLVFLYDPARDGDGERAETKLAALERSLRQPCPHTRFETMPVSYQDPASIEAACESLAGQGGAVFDLSGGNDLAAAVVSGYAAKQAFPRFTIDPKSRSIFDLGGAADCAAAFVFPKLTIAELAAANGVSVNGNMHRPPAPERFAGILQFFRLTARDPKGWRQFCNYLQEITNMENRDSQGRILVDAPAMVQSSRHKNLHLDPEFARPAARLGFLERYRAEGGRVRFCYPDAAACRYMITQGVWLEMFLYITAAQLGQFDECKMSLLFDWNGRDREAGNVVNEIDVVLMRGFTPLFISCKTSVPATDDLNEILLYTRRFGGSHARAALATTAAAKQIPLSVKNRAAEMDVLLLAKESLSLRRLEAQLRSVLP